MKVIDLLNKIANGERPNSILYKGKTYNWNQNVGNYILSTDKDVSINWDYVSMFNLENDEVEVEDKKIEKLEIEPLNIKDDLQRQIELVHYENVMIANAVNEIIDKINKGE